jgi:hypothetical protein
MADDSDTVKKLKMLTAQAQGAPVHPRKIL